VARDSIQLEEVFHIIGRYLHNVLCSDATFLDGSGVTEKGLLYAIIYEDGRNFRVPSN
jgi:hypothetical protein